jgi:hypothetical protein
MQMQMKNRLVYPLTETAKQTARELVWAWDAGLVAQYFAVQADPLGGDPVVRIGGEGEPPRPGALLELAHYGLIAVERETRLDPAAGFERDWWSVLLLQELRDAVARDFVVSDFFLATRSAGALIQLGEGTVGAMPPMENVEQLSDKLMLMMGDSAMEAHPPLRAAIDDLRDADTPAEIRSRAGRVIEEVGRGVAALANAGAAIEAIQLIGHFLG